MVADREGFERFFRERYPRVVRACALVTLDPAAAEEIAAEAFSTLVGPDEARYVASDGSQASLFRIDRPVVTQLCARPSAEHSLPGRRLAIPNRSSCAGGMP